MSYRTMKRFNRDILVGNNIKGMILRKARSAYLSMIQLVLILEVHAIVFSIRYLKD